MADSQGVESKFFYLMTNGESRIQTSAAGSFEFPAEQINECINWFWKEIRLILLNGSIIPDAVPFRSFVYINFL